MINKERMINNFITMAKISSPTFNERAMADYVISQFNRLGYDVIEDDSAVKIGGNTGNLIINIPGTIHKTILLSAHLDTVVPCDKINVIRENGKIYTDKTSVLGGDDKLGIATILELVEILQSHKNKPNLKIVISVAEEKGLQGASALDPKYLENVDFGFVLDGGDDVGTVTNAAPYRIAGELIVIGKEAHAGLEPEKGINALLVAAEALTQLKIGRIDDITTSNIGIVSGGLAQNIVMKEVRMLFETRSIKKENIHHQQKLVVDKFNEVCGKYQIQFKHTLKEVTTGYEINEGESISYYQKACEILNVPFKKEASGGASDANVFNKYGVQCLVISVGMKNVHTVEEYVLEEDFVLSANVLLKTLLLIQNEVH